MKFFLPENDRRNLSRRFTLVEKKQSPRGEFACTLKRGREKQDSVLLWLAEFHYSTATLLAQSLGVDPNGQRHFFKKLLDQGLLRAIHIPTVRERIFLLNPLGRQLARELTEKAVDYATEPSKVNASLVRHNLSVQIAVLRRKNPENTFVFERHLDFTTKDKLPDALMIEGEMKTALEVELTHKKNARVFRGFFDHLKLIKMGHYQKVEYIFGTKTLCENYLEKFNRGKWPVYEKRNYSLIDTGKVFMPDSVPGLRERFVFTAEELL